MQVEIESSISAPLDKEYDEMKATQLGYKKMEKATKRLTLKHAGWRRGEKTRVGMVATCGNKFMRGLLEYFSILSLNYTT